MSGGETIDASRGQHIPEPFPRAATAAAVSIGLLLGVGAYTFGYARGYSYVSNDPAACSNCHIMTEHFSAWIKSSHRNVAVCNDCHTPHNLVGKYLTKARNGFWHSFYFTLGRYPDPLRATARNRQVTEEACRHCHAEIVAAIDMPDGELPGEAGEAAKAGCVRCHAYVGHFFR